MNTGENGKIIHENISIIFRRGALEVMKREEFLKQLEQLLDGISEEEKADALAFTAVILKMRARKMRNPS